jgi:hypothetical protein
MQNPTGVVAHAKMRADRPGWAASEAFHDSSITLGNPRLRDHQAERRAFTLPTPPLCSVGH